MSDPIRRPDQRAAVTTNYAPEGLNRAFFNPPERLLTKVFAAWQDDFQACGQRGKDVCMQRIVVVLGPGSD